MHSIGLLFFELNHDPCSQIVARYTEVERTASNLRAQTEQTQTLLADHLVIGLRRWDCQTGAPRKGDGWIHW